MTPEAIDFRDESQALHDLLAPLADADFATTTAFKDWTLNEIVAHLHFFNVLADESLTDETRFDTNFARLMTLRAEPGATMLSATDRMLDGLSGQALLAAWRAQFEAMTPRWQQADSKKRLKWVGPTMSVRSSITARLMETWSHAQAVYDLFALTRSDHDRIRSVVVLGVNTFAWAYQNRKLDVPAAIPQLRLTAPSGELWTWQNTTSRDVIEGPASDFCQVVTQTRNILDTRLAVTGDTAHHWMSIAQCFAGPANDPPVPGSRRRAEVPPPLAT